MPNIKLTIAYDGASYSGWQIQPNAVTVQELVQKAVRGMTGEENSVVGAGRTDAGVHALAQVASFRTEKGIPLEGFRRGLNSILPRDIRILDVEEVPQGFHPIRDARSKHYRYIILMGEFEHPLYVDRSWCIRRPLDVKSMRAAASYLIGEHDFSAFRAGDDCSDSPVREITDVDVMASEEGVIQGTEPHTPLQRGGGRTRNVIARRPKADVAIQIKQIVAGLLRPLRQAQGPRNDINNHFKNPLQRGGGLAGHYQLDITGNGFLKNMVRNIVGTLVDVGLGRNTPEQFKEILDSGDRKKAGVCAPASGLYLVGVEY